MLLASLSLLILGALAAFVITRAVTRPLARTQEFAEAVARGNLDQTLNVRNSDETGRLADALRHMVQNLRQTITAANDKAAEARIATRQAQEATAQAEQATPCRPARRNWPPRLISPARLRRIPPAICRTWPHPCRK